MSISFDSNLVGQFFAVKALKMLQQLSTNDSADLISKMTFKLLAIIKVNCVKMYSRISTTNIFLLFSQHFFIVVDVSYITNLLAKGP